MVETVSITANRRFFFTRKNVLKYKAPLVSVGFKCLIKPLQFCGGEQVALTDNAEHYEHIVALRK